MTIGLVAKLDKKNMTTSNITQIIALSKGNSFAKKCWFFVEKKNADGKINAIMVLKGIFSETEYFWVLTC